jgi:hypothetical protein
MILSLSRATQFVDEYKALNLNKLFFFSLLWNAVVVLLTQRYPAAICAEVIVGSWEGIA